MPTGRAWQAHTNEVQQTTIYTIKPDGGGDSVLTFPQPWTAKLRLGVRWSYQLHPCGLAHELKELAEPPHNPPSSGEGQ